MKVRDLIKDTVWMPGRAYEGATPAISVLLPVSRDDRDGLLARAVESVLAQTEHAIELIIVDDASGGGIAGEIATLMRQDGRVSCLRHPSAIGLPAVSLYEALRRARGRYLAFAFPDFIFEPDALAALRKAAERQPTGVVHGYCAVYYKDGRVHFHGRGEPRLEYLAFANSIGTSTVLLPRAVVDDIGFFDPHVASAELSDWDLWRRIWRDYPVFHAEIFVGRDLNAARAARLADAPPANREAMQEYNGRPRNELLRPDTLADFDVWEMPPDCSACLAAHIVQMRGVFAQSRTEVTGTPVLPASEQETLFSPHGRMIGVAAPFEASLALLFEGVLSAYSQELLLVPLEAAHDQLRLHLSRCDAVILVRQLLSDHAKQVISICRSMNIPLYYLTDDNFIALRQEMSAFAAYTKESVAAALTDFAGVICSTVPLADYFQSQRLHASVQQVDPVFDSAKFAKLQCVPRPPSDGALRLGFIGSEFRLESLNADVVPALDRLAADVPLTLFSHKPLARPRHRSFGVTILPFTSSLDDFLVRWRATGVDVVVHPSAQSANLDYKTSSILLSALYLGAVPIVAADPAFRGLGEEQGVLTVSGEDGDWEAALRRVLDPRKRQELLERLEKFCRFHFSAARMNVVLQSILATSRPVDLLTWGHRLRQAPALPMPAVAPPPRGLERAVLMRLERFLAALRRVLLRYPPIARAVKAAVLSVWRGAMLIVDGIRRVRAKF